MYEDTYGAKTVYHSDGSGSGYVQLDAPGEPRFCLLFFGDAKGQEVAMGDAESFLNRRRELDFQRTLDFFK